MLLLASCCCAYMLSFSKTNMDTNLEDAKKRGKGLRDGNQDTKRLEKLELSKFSIWFNVFVRSTGELEGKESREAGTLDLRRHVDFSARRAMGRDTEKGGGRVLLFP